MTPISRSALCIVLLASAIVSMATHAARAETIEDAIHSTQNRLTEAKRARLNLISPRSYEAAEAEFQKVQDRFAKGGKIQDIQRRLVKIDEKLADCEELQEIGNLLLRDAFTARDDAIAANAPEVAVELWTKAERKIRDAGRRVEDGKQNGARKRAGEATSIYRDAELLGIRIDILGSAQAARDRALELKAGELARMTLQSANHDLAEAEKTLQGDRRMKAKALELAESAREGFRHAALISVLATKIDKDRKGMPESVVLSYEKQIDRIAEVLSYRPEFSEGVEAVADQVIAAVTSVVADREELVGEVASLRTEIDGLHGELASLQDRDETLQQKERYDRKIDSIRSIFAANEAKVLLSDSALIIRLYALSFPVGSSEIRPENFALLTRVQRALREFPDAAVAIEGHTDSQGNEDTNQSLSVRRASAVRAYLQATMASSPLVLTARGYGESRPIANNELDSGRAMNRRIDIVIGLEERPAR